MKLKISHIYLLIGTLPYFLACTSVASRKMQQSVPSVSSAPTAKVKTLSTSDQIKISSEPLKLAYYTESDRKTLDAPAMDKAGNLYVANLVKNGVIYRKGPQDSGFKEWITMPSGGQSASLRFGKNNLLHIADYKNHRIYTINPENPHFNLYYENKKLHQPNDMAIAKDGSIYFTDPTWNKKLKGSIYHLAIKSDLISTKGNLKLLITNVKAANGLDLSPDEKKLYFTESITGKVFELDLITLSKPKMIHEFQPDSVDGLRVDIYGNLFITRITKGQIDVLSSEGELIHSISLKKIKLEWKGKEVSLDGLDPTNISFGGESGNLLYVTIRQKSMVVEIKTNTAGREWQVVNTSN